ncbi:MAG TPA: DUF4388 domain-containing protein, partial [Chthoniobacterales bacterium]|nr:DUF4388 domain-containing protein [Chthoniobacterales bacterium]
MPAPPKQSAGRAGHILLIEDYGALGAAITAALKKFAPNYTTKCVKSVEDAALAAREVGPELLVIDFDPPKAATLPFLLQMQSGAPEARVLVIASGTAQETLRARPRACALHFLEKPFDLVQFGASVQELINPQRESANLSLGTLADLNLLDIIPLQCIGGGTSSWRIEASDTRAGELHFHNGKIVHAQANRARGPAALEEMVTWTAARFAALEPQGESPRTIEATWQTVIASLYDLVSRSKQTDRPPEVSEAELTEPTAKKK